MTGACVASRSRPSACHGRRGASPIRIGSPSLTRFRLLGGSRHDNSHHRSHRPNRQPLRPALAVRGPNASASLPVTPPKRNPWNAVAQRSSLATFGIPTCSSAASGVWMRWSIWPPRSAACPRKRPSRSTTRPRSSSPTLHSEPRSKRLCSRVRTRIRAWSGAPDPRGRRAGTWRGLSSEQVRSRRGPSAAAPRSWPRAADPATRVCLWRRRPAPLRIHALDRRLAIP